MSSIAQKVYRLPINQGYHRIKDACLDIALTTSTSILGSQLVSIPMKESAFLGITTSIMSSLGRTIFRANESDYKKIIVSVAALAITYFGTMLLVPTLGARVAIQLTSDNIRKIVACNAIGQVVFFAVAKLSSKLHFTQNIYAKNVLGNVALTTITSILALQFTSVSTKECALLGVTASIFLSIADAFVARSESYFKKLIASVTALAITYFGITFLLPTLNNRFVMQLTSENIRKIIAYNVWGQSIYFGLSGAFQHFSTPWNYSDDDVIDLNRHPEKFTKLSAVEQQLIYTRFELLGLDVSKFYPQIPTEEEISALTDGQIHILYAKNVLFNHEETDLAMEKNNMLLRRYFDVDCNYRSIYRFYLQPQSLPIITQVKEVEKLSPQKLMWFKKLFDLDGSAIQAFPKDVQWAFYQKDCTRTYYFNSQSIKTAPPEQIYNIMDDYNIMDRSSMHKWNRMSEDIRHALAQRCDELRISHWPASADNSLSSANTKKPWYKIRSR